MLSTTDSIIETPFQHITETGFVGQCSGWVVDYWVDSDAYRPYKALFINTSRKINNNSYKCKTKLKRMGIMSFQTDVCWIIPSLVPTDTSLKLKKVSVFSYISIRRKRQINLCSWGHFSSDHFSSSNSKMIRPYQLLNDFSQKHDIAVSKKQKQCFPMPSSNKKIKEDEVPKAERITN